MMTPDGRAIARAIEELMAKKRKTLEVLNAARTRQSQS